jgi:hypothetical protein
MVTTPAILTDLIEQLSLGRLELNVIAKLGGRRDLANRLQQLGPDLVVIGLRRAESDAVVTALLDRLPKAKFVVFSHDGRNVVGYELRVKKFHLSDFSPDALMDFVGSRDWRIGT